MGYVTPADVGVSDNRAAHIARRSLEPGTDYKTAYGTDLRMAGDGTVGYVDTSNAGAEGRRLRIDLDDGRTVDYIHLSEISARVGQRVKRGQTGVVKSGASGYGKDWYYDPHVHVTLRAHKGLPYNVTLDFEDFIDDENGSNEVSMILLRREVTNAAYVIVPGEWIKHVPDANEERLILYALPDGYKFKGVNDKDLGILMWAFGFPTLKGNPSKLPTNGAFFWNPGR